MSMIMTIAIIVSSVIIKTSSSSLMEQCTQDPITRDCEEASLDCQNVKIFSLDAVMIETVNFSITCLSLRNTHLTDLEENSFEHCQLLKYLDLQGNFLNKLSSKLFWKLADLQYLDLSNNSLMYLREENLFRSQKKLKVLNLSFNGIFHIDYRVVSVLSELITFNLSGNPIHCDCYLLPLFYLCRNRRLNTSVICADPEEYEGASWNIIETDSNCTVNMGLVNSAPGETHMMPKYEETSRFPSLISNVFLLSIAIIFMILICGSTVYALTIIKRRKKIKPQSEKINYNVGTEEVCVETEIPVSQQATHSELPYTVQAKCEMQTSTTESSSNYSQPVIAFVPVPSKSTDTEILVKKHDDESFRYSGEYDNVSSDTRY
ncbi:hypothetical protein C0J52_12108 [Blattella germanica]|nr:hypothetical protein C0J52_12108 [Blattella germanica]